MGRLIIYSNPTEGREAEFNDWYDKVHLAEVLAVGPFTSAQRFKVADAQLMADQPGSYVAIYEFTGSADDAVAALRTAAATFDMSDAMDLTSAFGTVVEEL